MSKIKKSILIIISLFIIITLGKFYFDTKIQKKQEIDKNIAREKITSISELATVKYEYKDVVFFKEDKKMGDFTLPFTKKKFLVVYEGYLKAGINMKEAKIRFESEKIYVKLPESKILDNVIDEKNLKIYDEESSIFNKMEFKDLIKVLKKEKLKVEKEAIEKGFLKESNKKTKQILENLLLNGEYKKIIVE